MIPRKTFDTIRKKHGRYASWAVWAEPFGKPKSGMGCMDLFTEDRRDDLLPLLRTNVIMVGLNFSRPVNDPQPFRNFHDPSPWANDFKIRHAFLGTEFYGAYMTDVIKLFEEVNSKVVLQHLRKNPNLIEENLKILREEIADLGTNRPTILAFGKDTHSILKSRMDKSEYTLLIKLTHYSHQIAKDDYRDEVLAQIKSACCLIEADTEKRT